MEQIKTIGIIGTRRRDSESDFIKVKNKFNEIYFPGDRICSGLCSKGGDWFAILIAGSMGWIFDGYDRKKIYNAAKDNLLKWKIEPIWYPADWNKYGKGAGFVRNKDIAFKSDVLIACISEDRTGGTEDTIQKFLKMKSPYGKDKLWLI